MIDNKLITKQMHCDKHNRNSIHANVNGVWVCDDCCAELYRRFKKLAAKKEGK